MIRLALCSLVIAVMACGSTAPVTSASPPKPPEAGAPPADHVATAAAPDAPPEVVAMPPELLVRPPVDGVGAMLFMGSIARIDGIAITFARSAHKQLGRRTTSVFDFDLAKAGKKLTVQLTTEHEKFQAEIVAHGALFVFEQRKQDVFTVVLAAALAPEQLDERACFALIDAAAKRAGITDKGSTGSASDQGILRVRRNSWTAYCGRYTKRVWFIPRAEASDGATP